jgi:hypothetical protein
MDERQALEGWRWRLREWSSKYEQEKRTYRDNFAFRVTASTASSRFVALVMTCWILSSAPARNIAMWTCVCLCVIVRVYV